MPDPILVESSALDTASHVAGTVGGGGLVATVLAFFRSRDERRQGERLAVLEMKVDALHRRVDALQDRLDDAGVTAPVRRRVSAKRAKKK